MTLRAFLLYLLAFMVAYTIIKIFYPELPMLIYLFSAYGLVAFVEDILEAIQTRKRR